MVLGLLAAGSLIAAGIAAADVQRDKNNPQWDPKEGGYGGAKSLEQRVTQYITQGGRPEYQEATSQPKTFTVYNQPYAKQNGAEFGTFEYYKAPDGTYTRDLTKIANVSMDDNGKITVNIPDKWKDDEEVKEYIDNYMLKTLSGNYKFNKDVKYQDPYDETKQITTQEYIDKINEALKFRVGVLDAMAPTKANMIARFGGTEAKNAVANNISTKDLIIMSMNFDRDDSLVPIPAYMLLAYPNIELLETYNDGFVQKKDFLENFYNIENGTITEANAYGIATTPEKMLSEIEDMTPDEVAKTIAFGNFIGQVDPKRSNWQQFLQAGDALSKGFYGGFYDWWVGTSDLIANIGNLSLIKGGSIDTRDFWNGMMGIVGSMGVSPGDSVVSSDGTFDATKYMADQMKQMARTNKDALTKAQAGYVQGRLAGMAVDMVVSTVAIGEATKAASSAITSKITSKGAEKTAIAMAEAGDVSKATGVANSSQVAANTIADVDSLGRAASKVAQGSANYRYFFSQTWDDAFNLYTKALGGTAVMLQSMGPAQLAGIVNSAAKVATAANFANTAVNVLGTMVIAAVVGNKDLTTKVLSSKATSDEAKSWVLQVAWDTAKIGMFSMATGLASEELGKMYKGSKIEAAVRQFNQKMSQKTNKAFNKISHPWLTFMKWYLNNKAATAKVSNAKANARAASQEALKEAVLMNEMRAYGVNLSTQPGSYGVKLVEDALEQSGIARGVTMSETLQNLARAGIVFDPATLDLSEYEAWQADYTAAQNALTKWNDVSGNISQVVHEFTNPNISPTISQQMTEINNANAELFEAEKKANLLSDVEVKANKKLLKEDEGFIYAFHSFELSRYIIRRYELSVVINEAYANKITDLSEYQPYLDALERFNTAKSALNDELISIADKKYIPALTKAEHNIVDVMVDAGVYSRNFVEAMRANGKFGPDGKNWMRLVAKKDIPKGAYNPFSKMVKQDNLIALNKFKILEDDEITWPGNGLQELITEYGAARAEKALVDAAKKATGKTTEVVVPAEKTTSAALMKEYKSNFISAVKQGINSFVQTASGTVVIGKKRSAEQNEFLNQVATIGGVNTIDIDTLRAVMREKGVPLAEDIVDQESLDKFLETASDEAKKLILDVVGEKPIEPELTSEGWGDFWKNASPNVRKILRGELEKTSLQTGYGIKDTRARLNAQVPGFDVLDWSLLGREHTNGLVLGGLYSGAEDRLVKAYIMDIADLRALTKLDKNTEDMSPDAINKIKKDINVEGGMAIIPLHFDIVSGQDRFYPQTRWGHSGDRFPDWETYFNYLESKGVSKVPVAIDFSKKALSRLGTVSKFVDALDKATATGKKPNVTVEDVAVALKYFGNRDRVIKRLRSSAPESEFSWDEIRKLVESAEQLNKDIKSGLAKRSIDESSLEATAKELLKAHNYSKPVNAKDITSDVQQAFSEYAQIPLYHNQFNELGTIEANNKGRVPTTREGKLFDNNGAGDAIWLSPNASYTDKPEYGPNKTIGTIPIKYFMSDKEKNDLLDSLFSESEKLYEKKNRGRKEYEKKVRDSVAEMMEKYNGPNWRDDEFLADAYEINVAEVFDGKKVGSVDGSKIKEKKLSDKEQKRFDLLHEILGAPSGSGKDRVRSYRALAEYSGKPIIDISEDGFADGTAFFYYKGISPEFDKELNKQLKIQAKGTPYVLDKASTKKLNEWADNTTLDKYLDILNQRIPGIDGAIKNFRDIFLDKSNYANGKKIYLSVARNAIEDLRSKIDSTLGNSVTAEDEALAFILDFVVRTVNYSPKRLPQDILNASLSELGFNLSDWPETYTIQHGSEISHVTPSSLLKALQIKNTTAKGEQAWEAINPRNFANVPTEPEFKQPRNPSYEDYQRGLSEDEGLTDTILSAIKNEQYNKLAQLKENKTSNYESLINSVDRANAKVNQDITGSKEVQIAADEYRENKKDFEKSVLFNQKFSYMIKAQTAKNTMEAFAKENNITLPEGKGSAKNKMKAALWDMLENGKELPEIKGLKKTDIKSIKDNLEIFKDAKEAEDIKKQFKKNFYKMLDETDLFENAGGPNPLKYELDEDALNNDLDDAIDDLIEYVESKDAANVEIKAIISHQGYKMSPSRYEFTVLSEMLSKEGKKALDDTIKSLARKIVDKLIPQKEIIIKGNETQLYKKIEELINDKLELRLATAKTTLESMGETAESKTVSELLDEYNADIRGVENDETIIKTSNENGDIQYERVSPALADIYNARPTYTPMSTPQQLFNDLALMKKIGTTDLNFRSFSKQLFSDPAIAFATVGALPGTLQMLRNEIAYQFGPDALRALEKNDPLRYSNIQEIARRDGISEEEALKKNLEAIAKTQVPFTLLNRELLNQASTSKFGNEGALAVQRKNIWEKLNSGLRMVSDKFGKPQNMRETYVRMVAGETAFYNALKKGYGLEQAESFREYAINTATTNFRQKHIVFNLLRSTVPYLTSGISGAKSFWKMFAMDPVGVTSRIFTGFIMPIMYFIGEILSNDELRKKYNNLAESEKENHIIIAVGNELMAIPVGEELGQYTNMAIHVVETLNGENNYSFWNLMLNDVVNLIPGADWTGFTDPEMWDQLSNEAPSFLEVMENGVGKMLASTMPPVLQTVYMANTGRDLYTGKKINNDYVDIDDNGNAVIMTKSTSEFATAVANIIGGDSRVIEKVVSGIGGTVSLHILDTLTSAASFIGSRGESGSLTTLFEKAGGALAAPYSTNGYNELERRWNGAVAALFEEKKKIEQDDRYIKYNQEIAKDRDYKSRQNKINKRNDLFREYQKKVEALVKGYRDAGGVLDKWKFSKAASLLTFEDAIRANRQFMDINTNYSDAYKQAMQTLYNMGITNPEGPSSLGYIYTDDDGKQQVKMWTPAQIQIMQDVFYEQKNIHAARITAILNDGTDNSIKKQFSVESDAEQPYWDKYNATGKLSDAEWDAIDDLRKAHNAKVVLALKDYMSEYGAENVLSSDEVIEAIKKVIQVPSAYETVKGRYISSDNGKLDKKDGFAESYIKTIFGVR